MEKQRKGSKRGLGIGGTATATATATATCAYARDLGPRKCRFIAHTYMRYKDVRTYTPEHVYTYTKLHLR